MFTITFRCAVPRAPVTSASASTSPIRSPGSWANSARSGGTGSTGNTPMRSPAGRAAPVGACNESTCTPSHSASGPAAMTTCARRTASVRCRASIAGTILWMAPAALDERERPFVLQHGPRRRGGRGSTAAWPWADTPVAVVRGRRHRCGAIAGHERRPPDRRRRGDLDQHALGRARRHRVRDDVTDRPVDRRRVAPGSVPSRATVTSSSQCTFMLGSMIPRCRPHERRVGTRSDVDRPTLAEHRERHESGRCPLDPGEVDRTTRRHREEHRQPRQHRSRRGPSSGSEPLSSVSTQRPPAIAGAARTSAGTRSSHGSLANTRPTLPHTSYMFRNVPQIVR